MPTSDTVISRLQLVHPDLNHDGGAGLHTKIRNLYTKLGDMMNSRFFTADALANAASVDVEHNFKTAFSEMRVLLFLRDTGTGELTRINSTSSPSISQFTIAATPSFTTTRIRITNNSGAPRDIAAVVVHGKGAEALSDLNDVDLSTPAQSGQALVYNSGTGKFEPGASGDASFKMQQIAANVLTIKGGYLKLIDGRELATYDAPTYGVDISVSLLTLLATPVNGTTYYVYIDLNSLGSEQTQGLTGRKLYQITQSNMVLSSTTPANVNRARYIPIGTVVGSAGNTYETGNFTTYAAKIHDNGPLAISPKVYSLSQAVGSVGSASQIKAGHILEGASFPSSMTASKRSFYNLAADGDDDSGNARTLTNNGTTVFTGNNIFGTANAAADLDGIDDNFSSTSAHFNPGNGKSWAVGGWFKANDWTPAGVQDLFSNIASGADRGFAVQLQSDGRIEFQATNSAASYDTTLTVSNPGFTDATWQHFAMVYDFSTTTLKAYINGKLAASGYLANTRSVTSSIFRVGAEQSVAAAFFAGEIQDVFFVNDHLLTDADIRKLVSSKITHNAGIDAKNQDWKFILGSGVQKHPSWQPVVDQSSSTILYADFGDLDSTETVDISLLDMGMNAVAVPAVPPFDQTYTSNPTFPINHGLGEVPQIRVGYRDSSGDWHWTTGEGAVKADATQLKGSIQTYFDASATHVRIVANVGASPTGVKEATASAAGIVSTGAQTFGGLKTFQDGYYSGKITSVTIPAFSSSDLVGTMTDAPSRTININAVNGVSVSAISSGTVTFTFAKTGIYLVSANASHDHGNAYTDCGVFITIGGTAPRWNSRDGVFAGGGVASSSMSGSGMLLVNVTSENQTLTVRTQFRVTGSGTTGQHNGAADYLIWQV